MYETFFNWLWCGNLALTIHGVTFNPSFHPYYSYGYKRAFLLYWQSCFCFFIAYFFKRNMHVYWNLELENFLKRFCTLSSTTVFCLNFTFKSSYINKQNNRKKRARVSVWIWKENLVIHKIYLKKPAKLVCTACKLRKHVRQFRFNGVMTWYRLFFRRYQYKRAYYNINPIVTVKFHMSGLPKYICYTLSVMIIALRKNVIAEA